MLKLQIYFVHKRISKAQKPIAYMECPLQHNEEFGPHLRLDKVKPNMYCKMVHPKELAIVPKEAYNLLLPTDQLSEYE